MASGERGRSHPNRVSEGAFDVLSFGESPEPAVYRSLSQPNASMVSTSPEASAAVMDEVFQPFAAELDPSAEPPLQHSDITHSTHSAHLDLTHWGKWVLGIAVVGFDLELGQSLERLFPAGIVLAKEDVKNICFHSFPDSNTGCKGDTEFHFRFRSTGSQLPRFSSVQRRRYICGTVYFRQVPDPTLKRGFYQKSIVLLTELPNPAVYRRVCKIIAKDYFSGSGTMAINAACVDISRWPNPTPGTQLKLPLLGRELRADVPGLASPICVAAGVERSTAAARDSGPLLLNVFDNGLFDALRPLLSSLQLLWELMLTSEPVVVRASTPTASSRTVLALIGLTAPVQYMGDFRPYFTIQDTDCKTYVKQGRRCPCAILGVTNPYFDKALADWPTHVFVAEGEPQRESQRKDRQAVNGACVSPSRPPARNGKCGGSPSLRKRGGIKTTYKQLLEHDREFMKKLLSVPASAGAKLVRQHFWSLTQQFLIPLDSYLARLMPLKKAISPFSAVPVVSEFRPDKFMGWLREAMPPAQRPRKASWMALYARFIRSPNFRGWLVRKQDTANAELVRLYLGNVRSSDLMRWASQRSEIEVLDLFLQISDALADAKRDSLISPDGIADLKDQLEGLKAALPEDVRVSLDMSPRRRPRYSNGSSPTPPPTTQPAGGS